MKIATLNQTAAIFSQEEHSPILRKPQIAFNNWIPRVVDRFYHVSDDGAVELLNVKHFDADNIRILLHHLFTVMKTSNSTGFYLEIRKELLLSAIALSNQYTKTAEDAEFFERWVNDVKFSLEADIEFIYPGFFNFSQHTAGDKSYEQMQQYVEIFLPKLDAILQNLTNWK